VSIILDGVTSRRYMPIREYIAKISRLTAGGGTFLSKADKTCLAEIIGQSVPLIPAMSPSELRTFTKSLLIVHSRQKSLNNAVFRNIDKKFIDWVNMRPSANVQGVDMSTSIEPVDGPGAVNGSTVNPVDCPSGELPHLHYHSVISSLNSLSQIVRAKHDGGPPALRPDTVWKFLTSQNWCMQYWQSPLSALDKCEMLTVMGRLGLRPFEYMMYHAVDQEEMHASPHGNDISPGNTKSSKIFFSATDISTLRTSTERGRVNGRVCGAILSLVKLDVFACNKFSSFTDLIRLIPSRLEELGPMELSNLAYAITTSVVLETAQGEISQEESDFRIRLVVQILKNLYRKRTNISMAATNQIGIVHSALSGCFDIYDDECMRMHLYGNFLSKCLEISNSNIPKVALVNETVTSKAQIVVRKALDRIGLFDIVKEEVAVGPFRIDFAIPELRLGIEIDGPYHYYYKSTDRTSKTRFKEHVLVHKAGYRLISVPYTELKEEGDKVKFFEKKIREILNIRKSKDTLRVDVKRLIKEAAGKPIGKAVKKLEKSV
jgi:very-short-patch-repair endonuclease